MAAPLSLYHARIARQLQWPSLIHVPDSARGMGIYLRAGKGSGKSRLMGRIIAWQDFLRGTAQVVLDPNGPTIDNFLDKVHRLPPERQATLWPRICYVDMSAKHGHVVPWPLYTDTPQETLYESAQHFLEVIKRLDPHLTAAPIMGWNPLWELGTYVGMLLTALGCQITEAHSLLTEPEVWRARLAELTEQHPELYKPAQFILDGLPKLKDRTQRSQSFLNKIVVFTLDPTMRAMFGAADPGLDWPRVVAEGQTVLLDFRHEVDSERRRFKMLWAFQSFLRFIKQRGAGRHRPIGLIIDELTALYNFDAQSTSSIFAADLDELINVLARNYRVWFDPLPSGVISNR